MSRSFKLIQPELVYSVDDLLEKKNDDLERSQFATKGDIRDLSQQLPLEPAFAQDTNLVKAKKLQETLNQILDNNKLTDEQKSLLLIRAKKQLIFFKNKGLTEVDSYGQERPPPGSKNTYSQNVSQEQAGRPLEDSEILPSFTKAQKPRVEKALHFLRKSGKLSWTSEGELFDDRSSTVVPDSNITQLMRYHLASNRTRMSQPPGYKIFQRALSTTNKEPSLLKPPPKTTKRSSLRTMISKNKDNNSSGLTQLFS
jgi:hypothetical protein